MAEIAHYEFEALSTRDGFNRSLRHFKAVSEIIQEFESCRNLADILNEMLEEKRLELNQSDPVLHALLAGHPRYAYVSRSLNLPENVGEFATVVEETARWSSVDLVIAYYHPDLGLTLINPKNPAHWAAVQMLKKNELVTVYAGAFAEAGKDGLFREAMQGLLDMLCGKPFKTPVTFTRGSFKPPKAPPKKPAATKAPTAAKTSARTGRGAAAAAKGGGTGRKSREAAAAAATASARMSASGPAPEVPERRRRMTPMYSIPVTNELFHNGNVEAWKKIIESYRTRHPGLDVFIFYDGERIHDINTLFKWGKVKHGSSILIAVAGDDIQDVAKLQRYLRQGASPMFEAFLKFPVNTILNLF